MAAPATIADLVALVRKSGLVDERRLDAFLHDPDNAGLPPDRARKLARRLVRAGLLTDFQALQLLLGKWRGFRIGRYRVLEQLRSDSLGNVFLCGEGETVAHVFVLLLPDIAEARLQEVTRCFRETYRAAGLDHPNVAVPYTAERDGRTHFLVAPYLDGQSLRRIVKQSGRLAVARAVHYVRQAAAGLQHLHEAGLIHGDIQPRTLVLERNGTVKVTNLGLARLRRDLRAGSGRRPVSSVAAASSYLAPEQLAAGDAEDRRTDIFGLGAAFYRLLTGQHPPESVGEASLLAARARGLRADVPNKLAAVLARMMARDHAGRFPTAAAVVEALAPWAPAAVAPPSAQEMPDYCPALQARYLASAHNPAALPAAAGVDVEPRRGADTPVTLSSPAAAPLVHVLEAPAYWFSLPDAAFEDEPPPPEDDGPFPDLVEEDINLGSLETEKELLLGGPGAETEEDIDVQPPTPEEEGADVVGAVSSEPAAPRERTPLLAAAPRAVASGKKPAPSKAARTRAAVRPERTLPKPHRKPAPQPASEARPTAPRRARRLFALVLLGVVVAVPLGYAVTRMVRSAFAGPAPPAASGEESKLESDRLFEGAVEVIDAEQVSGWAWDKNQPDTPVRVDIHDGPTLLGSVAADIYRQDLHARGMGDGKHVFYFKLPPGIKDGAEHSICITFGGTQTDLHGSPHPLPAKAP